MGALRLDLSYALILSCHLLANLCAEKKRFRLIADRVSFNRPRFSRIYRAPAASW